MSYTELEQKSLIRPLVSRDRGAAHRAATPLELFFDLVFVVAIAAAASELHHAIAEDHISIGVWRYLAIFTAIWWPWLNFTWFASAFDNNDLFYRCCTFVQMAGVLILTAGIEPMFTEFDMRIGLVGYIVMRAAIIPLWIRVAIDDQTMRPAALRYAIGVALCQIGWTLAILFAEGQALVVLFCVLWLCELAVPMIGESASPTPWHKHHIIERYGLLTIIVLGEGVLAGSIAINTALEAGETGLWPIIFGGLLIVFSLWTLYFTEHRHGALANLRGAFLWGYAHFFLFASAAAAGAGIAVSVDVATHHAEITARAAALSIGVPVAIFLISMWVIHMPEAKHALRVALLPGLAAVVVAIAYLTHSVLIIGAVLAIAALFREFATRMQA